MIDNLLKIVAERVTYTENQKHNVVNYYTEDLVEFVKDLQERNAEYYRDEEWKRLEKLAKENVFLKEIMYQMDVVPEKYIKKIAKRDDDQSSLQHILKRNTLSRSLFDIAKKNLPYSFFEERSYYMQDALTNYIKNNESDKEINKISEKALQYMLEDSIAEKKDLYCGIPFLFSTDVGNQKEKIFEYFSENEKVMTNLADNMYVEHDIRNKAFDIAYIAEEEYKLNATRYMNEKLYELSIERYEKDKSNEAFEKLYHMLVAKSLSSMHQRDLFYRLSKITENGKDYELKAALFSTTNVPEILKRGFFEVRAKEFFQFIENPQLRVFAEWHEVVPELLSQLKTTHSCIEKEDLEERLSYLIRYFDIGPSNYEKILEANNKALNFILSVSEHTPIHVIQALMDKENKKEVGVLEKIARKIALITRGAYPNEFQKNISKLILSLYTEDKEVDAIFDDSVYGALKYYNYIEDVEKEDIEWFQEIYDKVIKKATTEEKDILNKMKEWLEKIYNTERPFKEINKMCNISSDTKVFEYHDDFIRKMVSNLPIYQTNIEELSKIHLTKEKLEEIFSKTNNMVELGLYKTELEEIMTRLLLNEDTYTFCSALKNTMLIHKVIDDILEKELENHLKKEGNIIEI